MMSKRSIYSNHGIIDIRSGKQQERDQTFSNSSMDSSGGERDPEYGRHPIGDYMREVDVISEDTTIDTRQ